MMFRVELHLNYFFFNGAFECGDGGIFKLLRWMQNLHQPTWEYEILCADIIKG
jgi:hypothetical protein